MSVDVPRVAVTRSNLAAVLSGAARGAGGGADGAGGAAGGGAAPVEATAAEARPPSAALVPTLATRTHFEQGADNPSAARDDVEQTEGSASLPLVLIVAPGSRGDVLPLLHLGAALNAAKQVRVAFACHAKYAPLAASYGFTGARSNFRALAGHGDPEAIRGGPATSGAQADAAWHEQLRDYIDMIVTGDAWAPRRQIPKACVLNWFSMPAMHAAEAANVAVVFAWFTPFTRTNKYACFLGQSRGDVPEATLDHVPDGIAQLVGGGPNAVAKSYLVFETLLWKSWGSTMNAWRRELGLPVPPPGVTADEWAASGQFLLALRRRIPVLYAFSPHVVPRPTDWPAWCQPCGYFRPPTNQPPPQLPASLVSFLDRPDNRPVVCAGLGSAATANPAAAYRVLLDCVRACNVRAIITTAGGRGIAPEDGATDACEGNVFVIDHVPHESVLPRVDAVLHHGGAGTAGACFAAGIPQIICPIEYDHFFWARTARALGVSDGAAPLLDAIEHGMSESKAAMARQRIRESFEFALGPDARAAAQRVREQLAAEPNGTDVAANVVAAVVKALV